jgi:hypothetical protein
VIILFLDEVPENKEGTYSYAKIANLLAEESGSLLTTLSSTSVQLQSTCRSLNGFEAVIVSLVIAKLSTMEQGSGERITLS